MGVSTRPTCSTRASSGSRTSVSITRRCSAGRPRRSSARRSPSSRRARWWCSATSRSSSPRTRRRQAEERGARSVRRISAEDLAIADGLLARRLPAPERGARPRLRPRVPRPASPRRRGCAPCDLERRSARPSRAASGTAARAARRRPQPARDAGARRRARCRRSETADRASRWSPCRRDKDGAGILELLAPHVDRVIATSSGARRSARCRGRRRARASGRHRRPRRTTTSSGRSRGPARSPARRGAVLVCGTLYLLSRLAALEGAR